MSYDLVVWEGEQPADDEAAEVEYDAVMELMEEDEAPVPTPRIRAYVEALLQRWPDITTDQGEDSPWATGPLIDEARGGVISLSMQWSRADEASGVAARLAHEHGLVCYDPQTSRLRA
ncbi:hypothetical protein ABZT47_07185 [Sphaerisporangium sp. NPDC005289]|uniref:hypothetical protein n=1 Tax=Sphaerisporangium sp. NPDC005289 TaxID=3155247 RepID=UPI0033BBAC81